MATPENTNRTDANTKAGAKKAGRFTPKAEKDKGVERAASGKDAKVGRYTPPAPKQASVEAIKTTKPWVPYVMFGAFALGLILIVANYIGLLPSAPSNWYLLGGIGAISVGFIAATQLY